MYGKGSLIKQFETNDGMKKTINDYLLAHDTDLKTAMDSEFTDDEAAAIIHNGLPTTARKICSLEKMETFFWAKRDLVVELIAIHLAVPGKKESAKAKR